MRVPTRDEVIALQRRFFLTAGACVVALVVVHAVPKDYRPWSPVRLACTVVFFAAGLLLLAQLLKPRREYLAALYAWRFEDAPPTLDRAWQRYLYALDLLIAAFVWILLGFTACTALAVLRGWFPGLGALQFLYDKLWWGAAIALVALPFAGGFLFQELAQEYRNLHRQVALSTDFTPRRQADLYAAGADAGPTPLILGEQLTFTAGGFAWRWDDFTKSCVVFGMPGSGKTTCVLHSFLEGLLGSARGTAAPSGLVLDPKGDFAPKVRILCRRYGRAGDLLVLDPHAPSQSIRWNPLDSDDDELELATRFVAVMETLGVKSNDTSLWLDSAKKFLRHAIALVRLTNPPGMPPCFADLQRLGMGFSAIRERTDRLDVADPRCEDCLAFFAEEWAELADETRTSVQLHITNLLDPFLLEPYRSQFAGKSTLRIADMVRTGKVLYVHMPTGDKEAMARAVGTFVKLEFFRAVRMALDKTRPSFFFCDEFQDFFTTGQGKGDADFFERSRQSNHANIIATLNLPALQRHAPRPEAALSLLGVCGTKLFLRNTDRDTNDYASQLFGEHLVGMAGTAAAPAAGRFRPSWGQASSSTDQYDRVVRPERFAQLATPARHDAAPYCEAILHLTARDQTEAAPRKLKWRRHPIEE